ncbi:chromate transporter [Ureibacillus xyleni]|uniref:Chromate transporter n=1 Tax=Ureibacillus xyleni TaxID=614648 RepID=A0A285ST65_9BACL|nr:chromate transporter [Ureibacillus xyleni]
MVTKKEIIPFSEKERFSKQKDIFIAFFRSGILGFGGGPSTIPLVHKEVVETFKMMNDEEFSDVLSIGNTLPGPIATKMAGYIGYRVGGWLGMITALIATILPTVLLMVILLVSLKEFRNFDFVKGMTNGVVPVVAVMLGVLTWDFLKKSKTSLGWKVGTIILVGSFIGMVLLRLHPGIIIATLLLLALFLPLKKREDGEGK